MRSIEAIKADIMGCAKIRADIGISLANDSLEGMYWAELFQAISADISLDRLEAICAAERDGRVEIVPETGIGDLSDGYHTFNELYDHRAVLFSVICNTHKDKAWKSKLHHDGTMYDGMFIVGIETPYGQATYHYDIEPYWAYFSVPILEKAPVWDGHTPKDAINRILHLGTIEAAEAAKGNV